MKKIILFFLILSSLSSYSQNRTFNRIPCENIHIPVCVYNIANKYNSYKNYAVEINKLKTEFKYLEKACIFLDICLIDSIPDYNFYYLGDEDKSNELVDLANIYHKPYYLNVYLTGNTDKSRYNGITKSNIDTSYIALSPTSFLFPIILRKTILNFFGLDVNSSTLNSEFANGTNSAVTTDSLWDTPADPYNSSPQFLILPPNGPNYYLYIKDKDLNGDAYNVMYDNIMSPFSLVVPAYCDLLTRNQWQRISFNESRYRFKRWKVEK